MAFLEIQDIRKSFDSIEVLRGLSISVERGSLLALLGPSGCGKSTLLRIIAGLDSQDSGKIIKNGVDISHLQPEKRNIGMVFQSYVLFPNMSAYENIEFALKSRVRDKKTRARKIDTVLELIGLRHLANSYPEQNSGGQNQRISIARSLVLEPELLLLDEPFSALDEKVRVHLRSELRRILAHLGITAILVTHSQEEAFALGDKIALLNGGEIVQQGSAEEIYNTPKDIFVASFIGSINVLQNSGCSENASLENAENGNSKGARLVRPEDMKYSLIRPDEFCEALEQLSEKYDSTKDNELNENCDSHSIKSHELNQKIDSTTLENSKSHSTNLLSENYQVPKLLPNESWHKARVTSCEFRGASYRLYVKLVGLEEDNGGGGDEGRQLEKSEGKGRGNKSRGGKGSDGKENKETKESKAAAQSANELIIDVSASVPFDIRTLKFIFVAL